MTFGPKQIAEARRLADTHPGDHYDSIRAVSAIQDALSQALDALEEQQEMAVRRGVEVMRLRGLSTDPEAGSAEEHSMAEWMALEAQLAESQRVHALKSGDWDRERAGMMGEIDGLRAADKRWAELVDDAEAQLAEARKGWSAINRERLGNADAENAALRKELEEAKLQLSLETACREARERQVDAAEENFRSSQEQEKKLRDLLLEIPEMFPSQTEVEFDDGRTNFTEWVHLALSTNKGETK